MEEIWKDIEGYEGFYQISNLGKVKTLSRKVFKGNGIKTLPEKILSAGIGSTGYYLVSLAKDLIPKTIKVHRIVATMFIQNPENKCQVNHKNGNKLDNAVNNLEWVTNKENVIHAWKSGFCSPTWTGIKGKDNPFSKPVIQFDKTWNIINSYNSVAEASEITGFKHISCCAVGARKSAGGYFWKYKCDINN